MRMVLALLGMGVLTACQTGVTGEQPVSAARPATVPVSANAGPGQTAVSIPFGAQVVQNACIDTRPSFDGAPAAIAALGGFVQSRQTGTYFSQTHDLSVKLVPGRCSVVMAGAYRSDSPQQLIGRTTAPGAVTPGRVRSIRGKVYMSFFVAGAS